MGTGVKLRPLSGIMSDMEMVVWLAAAQRAGGDRDEVIGCTVFASSVEQRYGQQLQ